MSQNFGELMIMICDRFHYNHQQMMVLRKRLTEIYNKQKPKSYMPVSLNSLAVAALRQLNEVNDLEAFVKMTDLKIKELARKVEYS